MEVESDEALDAVGSELLGMVDSDGLDIEEESTLESVEVPVDVSEGARLDSDISV